MTCIDLQHGLFCLQNKYFNMNVLKYSHLSLHLHSSQHSWLSVKNKKKSAKNNPKVKFKCTFSSSAPLGLSWNKRQKHLILLRGIIEDKLSVMERPNKDQTILPLDENDPGMFNDFKFD